jgi:hypothetical protein
MWQDIIKFVQSCLECQVWARHRDEEPLHPIWVSMVWEKVGLDVVHMPLSGGYKFLVFAQDDLSG